MFQFAVSALIGLGALTTFPAAVAATPFDGAWSLEVSTQRGACDGLYRYYVAIENGQVRVRTMSGQLGNPAGRIAPSGRVSSRLGTPADPVDIVGQLRRDDGRGTWSAPARGCSGIWSAARR